MLNSRKRNFLKSIIILAIIGISNYYSNVIRLYTEGLNTTYYFETKSGDFQYLTRPGKGNGLDALELKYQTYVKKKGIKKEKLYRTFRMNLFKFWNWYYYTQSDLYKYEYKKKIKR